MGAERRRRFVEAAAEKIFGWCIGCRYFGGAAATSMNDVA